MLPRRETNIWLEVERWEAERIYRCEGRDRITPRTAGSNETNEVME
jgi:hypothetical protein